MKILNCWVVEIRQAKVSGSLQIQHTNKPFLPTGLSFSICSLFSAYYVCLVCVIELYFGKHVALMLESLKQTLLFVGAFVPVYLVLQVSCNTSTLRKQLRPLDHCTLEKLFRCVQLHVLIFKKMSPDACIMCHNSSVGRALHWRSDQIREMLAAVDPVDHVLCVGQNSCSLLMREFTMAVNRSRVNCLEGSYAHHYTTIWGDVLACVS